MAEAGRFEVNLARTAPWPPCGRVTLPQMARILDFLALLPADAWYRLACRREMDREFVRFGPSTISSWIA